MLNVNSIQDRLAGMSLPQLQQYAQLHKDDPYIVTMAMHVASMKRKMATAEQGQPTPPQPPVVDQAIAQMAPPPQQAPRAMLPEEQGIGALPERSLAKMAGGGIVAFEEGGEVERYEAGGGILANSPTTAARLRPLQDAVNMARAQYDAAARSNDPNAVAAYLPALQAAQAKLNDAITTSMGAGNLNQALSELQQPAARPVTPISAAEGESNFLDQQPEAQQAAAPREDVKPTATAPAVSPEMLALQALAAGQKQPGAAGTLGVGSLVQPPEQYKAMVDKFRPDKTKVVDPYAKEAAEAGKLRIDAATQERDQAQKDIEALGEFGKEREARLKARELKLAKQEGENTGLALMNAGFAMMAGDSQYALQNIGKGAQVGTKSYVEGQEKLNAARERLDEAYGKLEEVRRGEKVANAREMRRLNTNIKVAEADVKDKGVAALRAQLGVEEAKAEKMADAWTQDRRAEFQARSQAGVAALNRQTQAQIALAQIQAQKETAAMPGAQEKLFAALSDPDSAVSKGAQRYAKILGTDAKGVTTLLAKYTGMEGEMALQQMESGTPAQRQQAAVIRGLLRSALGGGFTNAPGGGTVHDITQ